MKKEVEIRYELSEQEYNEIRKNLTNGIVPQIQNDIYFCINEFVLNGKSDDAPYIIRLRECNSEYLFTYKSFVDNKTSWIEKETKIGDKETMISILQFMGLSKFLCINKKRYSKQIGDIQINLDNIENLGFFIELEIMSENVNEAKNILKKFMNESLKIDKFHIINEGYVQLMKKKLFG